MQNSFTFMPDFGTHGLKFGQKVAERRDKPSKYNFVNYLCSGMSPKLQQNTSSDVNFSPLT